MVLVDCKIRRRLVVQGAGLGEYVVDKICKHMHTMMKCVILSILALFK